MPPTPPSPRSAARAPAWIKVAIAVIGVAVLAWRASRYWPFIADDALISLRYARRLVAGHGLTWTDGERVEGYSNLLWVAACAGLHALGLDLITAARALGLAAHAAVICAIVRIAVVRSIAGALALLAIVLAFALAGPIDAWAIGGLEQPLLVALLAWAVALGLPALDDVPRPSAMIGPGLLLGAVCLTRPDGILLGGGLCLGIVLAGRSRAALAAAVALAAPQIAALVAQLAFRRLYYGDWVPNTAHAKLAFTLPRLALGLDYVITGCRALLGIFVPAVVAVLAAVCAGPARRRRVIAIATPLVLWLGYVAVIGGDFFPAWRHLVPAIALAALLIVEGFTWLAELGTAPLVAGVVIMAGCVVDVAIMQARDRECARARHEVWEWRGTALASLLNQAFGSRQPLIAVDAAGSVPYFSELPALDMLGLNDRYLGQHPPRDLGRGELGHELGDGRYVLSRRPDLVMFCIPPGTEAACFRGGHEMMADPEFRAHYRLVTFETPPPYLLRARLRVRLDGKLGVERGPAEIRIPGLLFTGREVVARLVDGRVAAELPAGQAAELSQIAVEPGTWRVRVDADRGDVVIRTSSDAGDPTEGRGALELSHRGGPLTIELRAGAARARVAAVVLSRPPS
jgi:arabinofuranosyltransferase